MTSTSTTHINRYNDLLFWTRPPAVQEKIDRVATGLQMKTTSMWGYKGSCGLYFTLNFDEREIIDHKVRTADPLKNAIYFIDLGSGEFAWVNEVAAYLKAKHKMAEKTFHVIGVTGEGRPEDLTETDGNVTTHKIRGFKLENLLESFARFNLPVKDSTELVVSHWTFCHLVDPIGTLEQAYHLLVPGNGVMIGSGFHSIRCPSFSTTLAKTVGMFHYIARHVDLGDGRPDDFALFRPSDKPSTFAKNNFEYDQGNPLIDLEGRDNCHAQCRAAMTYEYSQEVRLEFGGGFYGAGTFVLEQLIVDNGRTINFGWGKETRLLFQDLHFLRLYLDSRPLTHKVTAEQSVNEVLEKLKQEEQFAE